MDRTSTTESSSTTRVQLNVETGEMPSGLGTYFKKSPRTEATLKPLIPSYLPPNYSNIPHAGNGSRASNFDSFGENTAQQVIEEQGTDTERELLKKLGEDIAESLSNMGLDSPCPDMVASLRDFIDGVVDCCCIPLVDGTEAKVVAPNLDKGSHGIFARIAVLLKFVTDNKAESDYGRYACNVANVGIRQFLSVGIPTVLRQVAAYQIAYGTEDSRRETLEIIAVLAAIYPIVLNIAGIFRDTYCNEGTTSSNCSRLAAISINLGLFIKAASLGILADMAPTLGAFVFVYCIGRDVTQLFCRLEDTLKNYYAIPIFISAVLYFFNQSLVGSGMNYYASPSGQGAANLSYVDDVLFNDLKRGAFNWGGEVGDQMLLCLVQIAYLMIRDYLKGDSNQQEESLDALDNKVIALTKSGREIDASVYVKLDGSSDSIKDEDSDDQSIELSPRQGKVQQDDEESTSASKDDGKFRFTLEIGKPKSWATVAKTMTGVHAARSIIFVILLLMDAIFSPMLKEVAGNKGYSAMFQAAILSVFYFFLVAIATREDLFFGKHERTDHTSYR